MASRTLLIGIVATALLGLLGALGFFQYRDPMLLVFALLVILMTWLAILIVHVLTHGIRVRVVGDERKGP